MPPFLLALLAPAAHADAPTCDLVTQTADAVCEEMFDLVAPALGIREDCDIRPEPSAAYDLWKPEGVTLGDPDLPMHTALLLAYEDSVRQSCEALLVPELPACPADCADVDDPAALCAVRTTIVTCMPEALPDTRDALDHCLYVLDCHSTCDTSLALAGTQCE